ncbi:MAG: transporter substrate-binding domain-containing protein [Lachnospiraceae bacterium]
MMKNVLKKITGFVLTSVVAVSLLAGCGASKEQSADLDEKKVLRVGMECAYAPFNWTQETKEVADGSEAVPIYGTNFYAYGYDVMVAQKLADQLGMELEVHKVDWNSIGISLDSGDYDAIIAGMGRTAERELSYSFTEPYYYRDNCIVVKKGGAYENVTKLSELNGTGCKLTTQLGTGWVPLLDQIEGAELSGNYETTSECFMAISNGVADVCVVDCPTAESAALTNDDLVVISLDENDSFSNDDEMVNVCIATRKNDTEFRDSLQEAMDAIGWNNKEAMDELMEKAISLQPAAN